MSQTIPRVPLNRCEFNKTSKTLKLCSEFFGMPSKFIVESNFTGNEVAFEAVKPGDPLFCEDGWDGEQCIYRPMNPCQNVTSLVIYNAY